MPGKKNLTWRIACSIKLAWDFSCLVNHVGSPSPLWEAPCLGRYIKSSYTWTWQQTRKQWSSMTSALSCCFDFPSWWTLLWRVKWSLSSPSCIWSGFLNYRNRKHCRMQDDWLEEASVDWEVPSSRFLHSGSGGALSSNGSPKLYSNEIRNTLRWRALRRAFVT